MELFNPNSPQNECMKMNETNEQKHPITVANGSKKNISIGKENSFCQNTIPKNQIDAPLTYPEGLEKHLCSKGFPDFQ